MNDGYDGITATATVGGGSIGRSKYTLSEWLHLAIGITLGYLTMDNVCELVFALVFFAVCMLLSNRYEIRRRR